MDYMKLIRMKAVEQLGGAASFSDAANRPRDLA